ncbi:SGNH/GDSL hydrolase family protein [Candidatus Nitronereus thalassa]|uniref:SGNH/GDSL hydrolase family protein n=1 Tax=Candidatus Nitronereus thalassa TaxID=3020898 RepID=A0ABU3K585_9BACT|nr:SGNH/GDSL hydrolase family protein [Candidatus Nitronereus thalassa]MDT7041538.1 SGNH/GDSL hydrolase family protein [Candidatus Nitronereus thalassa]
MTKDIRKTRVNSLNSVQKFISSCGKFCQFVGYMAILFVAGHFLLGAGIYVKHNYSHIVGKGLNVQLSGVDSRAKLPAYESYPDKEAFWQEQVNAFDTMHFEPYYHWRGNELSGKYINVGSDGVRFTLNSGQSKGGKKVFLFGGSTMWGMGVKDEHTIPSFLQAILGNEYVVYNYGETGWVSTQELNYLMYQLVKGNIPDVVVFYDGVNDGYAGAYSPAIPRDPHNLRSDQISKKQGSPIESSLIVKIFKWSNYWSLVGYLKRSLWTNAYLEEQELEKWDSIVQPKVTENTKGVIDAYEAHVRQVKALAKEYGFQVFFFWQPNLLSGTRNLLPYEAEILRNNSTPVFRESQRKVFFEAKARLSDKEDENIYFLGNMFDDVAEPIYIDWCHVGPKGNEIVAKEIGQRIQKIL